MMRIRRRKEQDGATYMVAEWCKRNAPVSIVEQPPGNFEAMLQEEERRCDGECK